MYRTSFKAFSILRVNLLSFAMSSHSCRCRSLSAKSKSFISSRTMPERMRIISPGRPVCILRISIPGVHLLAQNLYLSAYSGACWYICSSSLPSPRYHMRFRIALASKSRTSLIWMQFPLAGTTFSQVQMPRLIVSFMLFSHLISSQPPQIQSGSGMVSTHTDWH